jgi:hypothetical protein
MPIKPPPRRRSPRWRSTPVPEDIGKLELTDADRLSIVLKNYDQLRDFYQLETIAYSRWFTVLQWTAVAGGALTPVLLLLDLGTWWRAVAALPSAIGAIAAGVNGAFRYRQEWASSYYTLSQIVNEYDRFASRTPPDYATSLSSSQAINSFQNRLSAITMEEIRLGFDAMNKER